MLVRNQEFLSFHIKDFNGFTFGGEWLVALHDNVEAGLGLGFYQESVPPCTPNFVNANGSEIGDRISSCASCRSRPRFA